MSGPPPLARGELGRRCLDVGQLRTTSARAGRTRAGGAEPERRRDHPRSRGENASWGGIECGHTGPPPLARGERRRRSRRTPGTGTTPARAGRTNCGRSSWAAWWDHPRSRGENTPFTPAAYSGSGPPPLARGEPATMARRGLCCRTTPARAGRTSRRMWLACARRDHPRSRGENDAPLRCYTWATGPPPLARGEPPATTPRVTRRRTTPARAGRTLRFSSSRRMARDHPRSRGENHRCQSGFQNGRGPPPLARGERRRRLRPLPSGRTTPARAGRTRIGPQSPVSGRDHPRSRGEDSISSIDPETPAGPPPLARGRPARPRASRRPRRTTPARAGKTTGPDCSASASRDHPRSRGEDMYRSGVNAPDGGPPPLARGRLERARLARLAVRTTPARAEKTLLDLRLYLMLGVVSFTSVRLRQGAEPTPSLLGGAGADWRKVRSKRR